jgi:hypothetical protein
VPLRVITEEIDDGRKEEKKLKQRNEE